MSETTPSGLGGGARPALTADLIARAIIAAALAYGDDPVKALTVKQGRLKRAIGPAVEAVAAVTGVRMSRVARLLGCRGNNLARGRSADEASGRPRALRAAERAVRYACWRPEARESLVGGAGSDAIAAPAAAEPAAPPYAPAAAPAAPQRPRPRRPLPQMAPSGPAKPALITPADERHILHIFQSNGGRGFPAVSR